MQQNERYRQYLHEIRQCFAELAITPNRSTVLKMTDDQELMTAIQAGNARAYESVVKRHLKSISHYAFRMLGNTKDTEDITQETFLRLWTHADTWRSEKASVSTWLHRITHNLCIDYLRKDKSAITSEYLDEHEGHESPAEQPDKEERLIYLREALAQLPERQRSAIVLNHYHGFSNREIAQIMDISVDALESILARARRGLKAELLTTIKNGSS
ncbi:MAG: RNA polymerase sigma factor [Gammaproteobacteria bacterium]|nr:RNA polymerase sigma factor [Gammaproteobacteria bacterium]